MNISNYPSKPNLNGISSKILTEGSAPFTHYSLKEYIYESKGKLFGSWNKSFSGACIDPFNNNYIEKDAIISEASAGKCSTTNKEVIKVVHN